MDSRALQIRLALQSEAQAVSDLVNRAYRGEEATRGWTTEALLIGGQRIDADGVCALIRPPVSELLAAVRAGALIGCVNVSLHESGDGYFGLLAVDPSAQTGGVGARLIEAAEGWVRARFSERGQSEGGMRMTVLSVRSELIAYYERRGYRATGETEAFPYEDRRFGAPFVPGLVLAVYRKPL